VVSQKLALEAKKEGFRSGLYTGLAVLDAERDLYQAKQDYALARYDYLLNSLRLKQGAGTLNYEDLTQVGAWFTQAE
jgi:outer membrane protein